MDKLKELEPIFYPKTLAVIGASADERKFGGSIFLRSLQEFGFKGNIYPVNPQGSEIFGLKMYPNVRDIPEPVDLAHIMVPAPLVPRVLEDCVAKGVKAAQIFTAGFSETGEEEGRRLEGELVRIARKGIRLIGPNCFGVYCPASGLTLLPGYDFPKESGPVAFLSQSGGYAAEFSREANGCGIRFSKVVSYGNACDLNEADFMEYLAQDPETRIITAYIEGPRDGRRFMRLVREVSKTKPVIIWKAGLTKAGARAVSSHTGSLSGEEAAWDALFKQSGALRVKSLEELIDTTVAFLHLPPTTGRRVAVFGGGGGISVAAADACEHVGLSVPPFAAEIQEQLRQLLPPAGTSIRNPIDIGAPILPPIIIEKILEIAAGVENIDTIIATQALHYILSGKLSFLFDTGGSFVQDSVQAPVKIKRRFGKPLIMVLPIGSDEVEMIDAERGRREIQTTYLNEGIPVYPTLERAARAVANVIGYYEKEAEIR